MGSSWLQQSVDSIYLTGFLRSRFRRVQDILLRTILEYRVTKGLYHTPLTTHPLLLRKVPDSVYRKESENVLLLHAQVFKSKHIH